MTRLKLDSIPAFRASLLRSTVESRPAPQVKGVPEPVRQHPRADGFERSRWSSGHREAGDVYERNDKGTRAAKNVPGPVGTRPLSEKLEPFKDQLNEIAQKVAQDSTLDTKEKVKQAIWDAVKALGLEGKDAREAFRETKKAARFFGKGSSDPDFGASGGIKEK